MEQPSSRLTVKETALAVKDRIKDHNVTVSAAGIAFYGLLALVPTLIALVSVYALVADPSEIEKQVGDMAGSLDSTTKDFVTQQLQSIVGDVEDTSEESSSQIGRWFGLGIGLALALFSASGALQKMMTTISVAYDADDDRPGWKVRLLAYGFTAGAIVGVAILILVLAVVPIWLGRLNLGGLASTAIQLAQLPIVGILFTVAITVLYRYSPDRNPKTPWRNAGAVVGTVLFILFSVAFSIYSSNVGALPSSYGLLGSVAALMIFLQLTSLAVIIGAEVNAAREEHAYRVSTLSEPQTVGALHAKAPTGDSPAEEVGLGKALVGFVALYVLGRQRK